MTMSLRVHQCGEPTANLSPNVEMPIREIVLLLLPYPNTYKFQLRTFRSFLYWEYPLFNSIALRP